MKLNLGSGGKKLEGYTNIDIRPEFEPDVVGDICDLSKFGDNTVDEVRLDATYEHIYPHKRLAALKEWYRVLRPGGKLVINWLPDFEALLRYYGGPGPCDEFPQFDIEMSRRLLYGAAPKDEPSLHKDLFNARKVRAELSCAGFGNIRIVRQLAPGETLLYNLGVVAQKP